MMKKYALFIDADGTLISFKGVIPASAIEALKKSKENGHYLFLSTGRCLPEINQSILDIGFDGVIASGGAYVRYGTKVLRNLIFDKKDVDELKDYFNQNNISVSFECNHCLYVSQSYIDMMSSKQQDSDFPEDSEFYNFKDILVPINSDTDIHDVTKVSFMGSEQRFEEIKNNFKVKYDIIDSSMAELDSAHKHGEIALKNVHKASAMKIILDEIGNDIETIALGDSENDIEMLKFADRGIAMGNAKDILKNIADEITDHVNSDGLYKALKAHKLFD